MSTNTIRVLPSPTWRWLKVNDVTIENIETIGSIKDVTFDKNNDESVYVDYCHTQSARECIDLKAAAGTKGYLYLEHTSNGSGAVAGLTLNCDLKEDSAVTVVQIINLNNADSLISGIMGQLGKNSRLNIIQVFLGGKDVYVNVLGELVGESSFLGIKSVYRLYKENNLDINYVINHHGKKTECDLESKGVLYKGAKKLYRGTIDFKKGCKGAVGNEIEDVLLMDDDVINKTVPVILCAEEDVEGNHGATIGRIPEELMFYMTSRGIDEEEVYSMMADARVDAVVSHIPDEKVRDKWLLQKKI